MPAAKAQPEPLPKTRVFNNPTIAGLPVDICRVPLKECHGEAAQAWCRSKGYSKVTQSHYVIFPETKFIGAAGTCKPRGLIVCGGYSVIACAN